MSETTETLADIVREMRAAVRDSFASKLVAEYEETGHLDEAAAAQALKDDDDYIASLADLLEAAVKRELSRAAEDAASKATLDRTAKDAAEYMAYAMAHNSAPQPGSSVAMRQALERILAIEGYGAPWLEAKCIAQKALEGEQGTPPAAQERPKIEQPGNAAALCVALDDAHRMIEAFLATVGDRGMRSEFIEMRHRIDAALAAPARNCDVGTAEEQIKRFETFCNKSFDCGVLHGNCGACPLWTSGTMGHDCEIKWSQLPFAPTIENGGNKQ